LTLHIQSFLLDLSLVALPDISDLELRGIIRTRISGEEGRDLL
jgi:hypothetical protein